MALTVLYVPFSLDSDARAADTAGEIRVYTPGERAHRERESERARDAHTSGVRIALPGVRIALPGARIPES